MPQLSTNKHSVAVLTVTYGRRWKFLSKVSDAVLGDAHVTQFIIIDNNSLQKEELQNLASKDARVRIISLEKNIGSAGGFALGLKEVRKSEVGYVLLLDDDIVPETGFVEAYLNNYELIGSYKVVLCGNRINIPGNEEYFMRDRDAVPIIRGTFFEIFSLKKIKRFFQIAQHGITDFQRKEKYAYVPSEGFAYGGTFLPIEAVRTAPLPDKDLVLYYDDIEYSWGVLRAGFSSYLCAVPKLYDIDMSFGEHSQTVGLCNPKSASFKAYYFLRNRVRVSVRNTCQKQIVLFLNIVIWMVGLCILGMKRYGVSGSVFRRLWLLVQAVYGGYVYSARIPNSIVLP